MTGPRPRTLAILAALDGSTSQAEIARRFGCSTKLVSWISKTYGAGGGRPPRPRMPRTSPYREPALQLIAEGMSYRAAGIRLGISHERVRQFAVEAGVIGPRSWTLARPRRAARLAASAARVAEAKAERDALMHDQVTLLRTLIEETGISIAQAGRIAGLKHSRVQFLSRRSDLGKITTHGRWRKYHEQKLTKQRKESGS